MVQPKNDTEEIKLNNSFMKLIESKDVKYTKQQMKAIFHTNGPALILAVPGSGKTTTIIGRIGNLILNHNVNPKNILAITFSKASALDMRRRFKNIFGDMVRDDLRFSTIHAFANMVVSSYNRKFNKNLVLLKSWQINYIIKDIYKDIFNEEVSEDKLEPYITGISYIKNKMLSKEDIEKYEGKTDLDEISAILNKYDELKREKNWYDYDDMLELCLGILKENKVTLEFLREKYKYILLDEGQDTSKLQFEIIKLLIKPKNNIFIVADDDQTIYDFRGACPEQLLEIKSFLPNIKTYFMEQNFRSTKEIISVANNVIRNNKSRYDKTMFTNKKESGKSVDLIYLEDTQEQSKYIVEHIINKKNDIALLYRNNLSAIPVANMLYKNGIRFYINNYKTNFFNHWIVKDVMCIIRLINDSSDVEALSNIYYKI
ncbi:ATP-dependent helicase, partial [Clostridium beijerinckii]|uniref:ATP-dependent helicase n=1 Tax=Clostridium beijerinckii TaxID=1520 RepID=UPI0022E4D131